MKVIILNLFVCCFMSLLTMTACVLSGFPELLPWHYTLVFVGGGVAGLIASTIEYELGDK
jgi:hypothetical protein